MPSKLKSILKLNKRYVKEKTRNKKHEADEICQITEINNEIMLDSTMCIDAAVRLLAAKNIKAALHFLMECITAIENAREYKGINKKPSEDAIRKLEKGIIYLDAGAADNERKVVEKLRDVRELIMSSTAKRMSKQRRKSIMYAVDLRTKWAHKFASGDRIVIRSRRHHEYIYRSKSGRLSLCAEPDTAADVTWKFKWVNRKQRIMSLRLRCDRDAIVVDRETLFRLVKCGPYIALESLEHPGDYVSFMIGLDVYGILMYQCTTRDDERIHFEFEKV